MTPVRIDLYGVGALGRRHLEALALLGAPVAARLVDPSQEALAAARAAFAAAPFPPGSELLRSGDAGPPDVAIVATTARERARAVADALERGARALILEKVLFTRPIEYDAVGEALRAKGARAYVNCARRTFSSFPRLLRLVGDEPFRYRADGVGWGLACNAVHHLDEFAALAGTKDVAVDASGLDPGYVPARRPGYVEFFGTLRASAPNGSTFEAVCREGAPGDRVVAVTGAGGRARVSQGAATLEIEDGDGARTIAIDVPLQSRATARHVRAILDGREPALPDYEAAAAVHRPMIAAFLDHLRRTRPEETFDECPIT